MLDQRLKKNSNLWQWKFENAKNIGMKKRAAYTDFSELNYRKKRGGDIILVACE